MRWVVLLLSAAAVATASPVHGAPEVTQIQVRPATPPAGSPTTADTVLYPGRTLLSARLRGLQVGRTYGVGARAFDANRHLVWRHASALTAKASEQSLSIEFEPPADSEPGEWRLLFYVEGAVVERAITGERRRQTAPLEVAALVTTPSIKYGPPRDATGSYVEPAGTLESIEYPGRSIFFARLRGFEPGRNYTIHGLVLDAQQRVVGERTWPYLAISTEGPLFFDLLPGASSAPGEWRLVVEVDGRRLAERTIHAARREPPSAPPVKSASPGSAAGTTGEARRGPPAAPPLKLTRALVTASLNSKSEPRDPVNVLGLPSAAYYYVEASGFVPKRTYQVHLTVADGAGMRVGDYRFPTRPWRAEHAIWYPLRPAAGQAPGVWHVRLALDDQLLAETPIRVDAAANDAAGNDLARWWPVAAAALLLTLAYMGWALATAPRAPAGTALPATAAPRKLDASLAALIAANLVPLAFVLFGGANAADLLLVYWCENLVVGLYAILRMLAAPRAFPAVLFVVPFFVVHFGIFTFGHYFFLVTLFGDQMKLVVLSPQGFHPNLDQLLQHPLDSFEETPVALGFQIAVLIVSHGISFAHNYLKRGEYLLTNVASEMFRPYLRLIVMHVAVIVGGFVALMLASPVVVLVLLVALKLGVDIYAHLRPPPAGPIAYFE